jgi:hypothetical protein
MFQVKLYYFLKTFWFTNSKLFFVNELKEYFARIVLSCWLVRDQCPLSCRRRHGFASSAPVSRQNRTASFTPAPTGPWKYLPFSLAILQNILEQFLRQLRSFLHQDLPVQLNRHLSKKGQPALRVVVLHDNLGTVNYALNSLRLELDQYWAYDRWNEVYELNGVEFAVLKNANRMKDEEWAKLCPVHLLVSCLPAKKFDPKRHQPAGR